MNIQVNKIKLQELVKSMESFNINQSKLENYAEKFAQKACDSFFSMFKSSVIGSEIMKITPVEQINYFVLFNLFETWKQEVAKLESPYFDYSKPEVKEALRNFMNTVSMHINIKREDIEPLLIQSVAYTINLSNMPVAFYANFFNRLPEKLSIDQLASYEKYFKINKLLYSHTLEKVKSQHTDEVSKSAILQAFAEASAYFHPDNSIKEQISKTFNTVLPVDFNELYTPVPVTNDVVVEAPKEEPAKPAIELAKEQVNSSSETQISDLKKENFKNNTGHIHNRVVDVKSAMTINQRFMFVEQLFRGEKWEFDGALNKLENCPDYDSAIKMLLTDYAVKYDWDTENEQVSELFDFIGKKYSN